MKINIIGEIFGTSGYSSHTRNLSNALVAEGIEVALSCNLPQGWEREVNDAELKMIQTNPSNSDYKLAITLPTSAPLYWNDGAHYIQFVVWEGDRTPLGWNELLMDYRIKYIFTPSEHTKQAIVASCPEVESKIHVMSHGADLSIFTYKPELRHKDELVFMADKGWPAGTKDRGGLSFLVKAYCEEFNADEKVKLLIKLNSAYGMNDQILNRNLAELKLKNQKPAPVNFIFNNIRYSELNDLYNKAHVFVISSLAESFHIGGIQAMACGLPVVYTDFGGQTDYCNQDNGWPLVQGTVRKIDWDVQYEEVSQKIPSVIEIRQILREIYTNRATIKIKSEEALKTAQKFTWSNTAKKIKLLLEK